MAQEPTEQPGQEPNDSDEIEAQGAAEEQPQTPGGPADDAELDPIAQILADQKAQLAGVRGDPDEEELSDADKEAMAQMEAAAKLEAEEKAQPAADGQEELSDADKEAMAQMEAAAELEADEKAQAAAEAEANGEVADPAADDAELDPIAKILAEQKAQLAGDKGDQEADEQEELSDADKEAMAQMEASAELEADEKAQAAAEAEANGEVADPAADDAELDPIAKILAEQKAQLAGDKGDQEADDQEELSDADKEAMAQMEASAELEAEEKAQSPAEASADDEQELDPIAKILAEQKAQLSGAPAEGGTSRIAQIAAEKRAKLAAAQEAPAADDQEELSDADKEALAQIEAAEKLAAKSKKKKPAEPKADPPVKRRRRGGKGVLGKFSGAAALTQPLKKLSLTHLFLFANTLAILALVFSVAHLPFRESASADSTKPVAVQPQTPKKKAPSPKVNDAPVELRKGETASWKRAQSAFAQKKYEAALRQYKILHQISRNSPEPDIAADLFQLRTAQCLEQLLKSKESEKLFQNLAGSRSPVIRGVANYHLAMGQERQGRFMQARRRAYLALAALASLSRRLELENNCDFLIAQSLTDSALSFYSKERAVNWGGVPQADPFAGLEDLELRALLDDGAKVLSGAMLGATVRLLDMKGASGYWTATCSKTPLSELLGQFATKAKTELKWKSVAVAVRNRPMSMHLSRVSGQKLCELLAGSAGLIVRFTGDTIAVYDSAGCESLKQQRDMLITEAGVVWRRMFLRGPTDSRIANGHFALALLQECAGDPDAAIREYRSTARSFSSTSVAPQALLRGAKLRIGLHDYAGARKELVSLLDTYPDYPDSTEVYRCLGEATMKAGKPAEAFEVFKKLFFLNASSELRLAASLGAGRCLYMQGKYKDAIRWLGDHITLAGKSGKGNLSQACLLLGRCYNVLGDEANAVAAFKGVLATKPGFDERIEACLALADAWRGEKGDLPKALTLALQVAEQVETGQKKYEALAAAAGIYRDMGLPERGIAFLNLNILKISDPEMQAKLRIELARCYRDSGRLQNAYNILIDAPRMLSPGRGAQEAACDLADVCIRMGRSEQAVQVASNVMKTSPAGRRRQLARSLLTKAYLAKKDYENAAAVMSNMAMKELGAKQ